MGRAFPKSEICYLLLTSFSHAVPPGGFKDSFILDGGYARKESIKSSEDIHLENLRWIGHVFGRSLPSRETLYDNAWQKSILSTKHIWFTGFHLPGACTANGNDWKNIVVDRNKLYRTYAIHVNSTRSAMFHYRNLITHDKQSRSATTKSEYPVYFWPGVLNRIQQRKLDQKILHFVRRDHRDGNHMLNRLVN